MIPRLLSLLEQPRSVADLAREMGVQEPVVESMLHLLEGRGYVGYAYDNSPTCGTSCGGCNVQRLCPTSGAEAPFLKVWRATGKARATR